MRETQLSVKTRIKKVAWRSVVSVNSKHSRYLDRKVTFPDDIPSSDGPLFPEKKHWASRIERQPRASLPIAILSHSRSFSLLHHFALITSRLYLRRALYFKLPLTKLYSSVTNDESHVLARLLLAFAFTWYPLPKVLHVPVDAPVLFTISILNQSRANYPLKSVKISW